MPIRYQYNYRQQTKKKLQVSVQLQVDIDKANKMYLDMLTVSQILPNIYKNIVHLYSFRNVSFSSENKYLATDPKCLLVNFIQATIYRLFFHESFPSVNIAVDLQMGQLFFIVNHFITHSA